jgi:hypothetical protein
LRGSLRSWRLSVQRWRADRGEGEQNVFFHGKAWV